MDFKKLLLLCAVIGSLSGTLNASPGRGPVAASTISHRVSKPGQRLELLITVRNAQPPVSALPECPVGLELKRFWKPQHLTVVGEDVWLLRFRLITTAVGDYEIPPIRISTGTGDLFTKPVILHVSNDAKPPLPDAKELALTTDIPFGLAQEAVKTCPTPAPKPSPSPTPKDGRPLPSRLVSSIGHGFSWFWNYPGK
jgi:hypothetical protein